MLGKRLRLPVHQFSKENKTLFSGDFLTMKVGFNKLGYNRVGVVVGRRVSRSAVQRNKTKRLIFNFLRDKIDSPEIKNKDILFILKKKTVGSDDEEKITKELVEAIGKLAD